MVGVNKKYYIISGAIIITMLVFVSVNENRSNYYKASVEDAYVLLMNSDINISNDELKVAGSTVLKINIVKEGAESDHENLITVPADKLLDHKLIKRLEKHQGKIAIVSEEIGMATHAWVILTRKGIENIKILNIKENETFEYSFDPERKVSD